MLVLNELSSSSGCSAQVTFLNAHLIVFLSPKEIQNAECLLHFKEGLLQQKSFEVRHLSIRPHMILMSLERTGAPSAQLFGKPWCYS